MSSTGEYLSDKELREMYGLLSKEQLIDALVNKTKELRRYNCMSVISCQFNCNGKCTVSSDCDSKVMN